MPLIVLIRWVSLTLFTNPVLILITVPYAPIGEGNCVFIYLEFPLVVYSPKIL